MEQKQAKEAKERKGEDESTISTFLSIDVEHLLGQVMVLGIEEGK